MRACHVTVEFAANEFATECDCSVVRFTVVHVLPPSVEWRRRAAVCEDPSTGLCAHENLTVSSVFGTVAPEAGDFGVGALGGHIVTTASDQADQADLSAPRAFLAL